MLSVTGLTKSFPGVRALDAVDFTARAGEVHALIGENGAGKSTLIKVLTGVYRPDAGEVAYAERPARFATPLEAQDAGISTIYQEVNLVPLMSVARNLLLGREPRNRLGLIDFRRMHREADEALRDLGVRVDVRRPLRELGVGAQQMVALARAVSVNARVVIMDEPTSSLEPREVRTLFGVIRMLRERGIAVIYVSHRLDELYAVCDAVTVLRDGKVVHTGPLADLDRLRLVALMLGREIGEVADEGVTKFTGEHHAESEPVLRAERLSVRHRLSGVSLDIRPGEVVGLGGLLGSGRSETAKAIAGALPPDSGRVTVAGTSVRTGSTPAAIRAGISLLPEDRKAEGVVPGLSVRENIALAALPRLSRLGLVDDSRVDAIVDTFMRRLRIKASGPHQKVGELSGGNQQKVLLARWLAMNPKVLLLDEPTRGIDVGAKAEVQKLIDELAQDGLGVLLISSDMEELVEGSDRVVVLKDGAVVEELTGSAVTPDALLSAIATTGGPAGAEAGAAGGPAAPQHLRETS
ncbi:sugar ABC transporter ATP-binding protein [Streptomyces alfalfae]|uniref:Sugar ABC transporter ATP-binding protein n=1 Tax=Streptomyces alfalfae TaxID=1642299 RepID=A0ABM6GMS9_9ACTN|nr:sugar ABC transporter ATP-binding protein [Streptomyces alfalfae]APY85064.1 sugar ABC transporter ATP-binding protein [Streptomyces alfalfae]AYA15401.1 sugar ABC transporter ATP-binding protein [Streptomyces fradiae]RXX47439.1 sugar ABC transporter ATP-binding protein [Streptomyces alfalfae]RZM91904.1 sugar ABC transporter ATP-binding protein [Streptomyces alfalfae]